MRADTYKADLPKSALFFWLLCRKSKNDTISCVLPLTFILDMDIIDFADPKRRDEKFCLKMSPENKFSGRASIFFTVIKHIYKKEEKKGQAMKIIKRSGVEVTFDPEKIIVAVTKANESVVPSARMSAVQIKRIAEDVEMAAQNISRTLSVEEI